MEPLIGDLQGTVCREGQVGQVRQQHISPVLIIFFLVKQTNSNTASTHKILYTMLCKSRSAAGGQLCHLRLMIIGN
jgi:hypothetical protein